MSRQTVMLVALLAFTFPFVMATADGQTTTAGVAETNQSRSQIIEGLTPAVNAYAHFESLAWTIGDALNGIVGIIGVRHKVGITPEQDVMEFDLGFVQPAGVRISGRVDSQSVRAGSKATSSGKFNSTQDLEKQISETLEFFSRLRKSRPAGGPIAVHLRVLSRSDTPSEPAEVNWIRENYVLDSGSVTIVCVLRFENDILSAKRCAP